MLTWIENGTGEPATAIDLAEKRLGVTFPPAYRAMLEEHAGGESEELESMLITVDLKSMSDYPKRQCLVGWGKADLAKLIPVFETVSGNFYALDYTQGEVPGVIHIDRESAELDPDRRYPNYEAFIAEIESQNA